jgi:hypothetical protein
VLGGGRKCPRESKMGFEIPGVCRLTDVTSEGKLHILLTAVVKGKGPRKMAFQKTHRALTAL